jgi:FecR protein
MRRTTWCLFLAGVAVLASAAPAGAVEYDLRATVTVPYQPGSGYVPTGVIMQKGLRYRLVISGLGYETVDREVGDHREQYTVEVDPLYSYCLPPCTFRGTQANPVKGSPLYLNTISDSGEQLDEAIRPGPGFPPPPNFSTHTYTVDWGRPYEDRAGVNLSFRPHGISGIRGTFSGSFTIQVFVERTCEFGATITRIKGDLGVLKPGPRQDWQDGRVGQKLCLDDELHTGPDSEVELKFADRAVVTIKELTEIRIRGLAKEESRIKIEILLRIGELKAQVRPQQVIRADFSVQTPTATAGVRGTIFTIKHDPVSKISTVATTQGKVSVDPAAKGKTVLVGPGDAVDVTKAGARDVSKATLASRELARVLAIRAVSDRATVCKVEIPMEPNVVGVTASGRSWKVTIRTNLGTTTWLVTGNVRVTPTNALAKRIAAGC